MKRTFLLLVLFLSSCTTEQLFLGGVLTGAGAFIANKQFQKSQTESDVIEVDTSGTTITYGGQLVSENKMLHVEHWSSQIDISPVTFIDNDGTRVVRNIINVENLGSDLNILTLDRPVDISKHKILPIGEVQENKPVTLYRMDRPPFGTYISDGDGSIVRARSEGRIKTGDSGKIWVQEIGGVPHVVSMTSTESSKGPNIHKILGDNDISFD